GPRHRDHDGRPGAPTAPMESIGAVGPRRGSALGVLRSLAGLLQAGLLALDGAGVPGQEPGALERGPVVLGVDLVERAGDPQAQRTGLAGGAATVDARDHVEAPLDVDELERAVHQ